MRLCDGSPGSLVALQRSNQWAIGVSRAPQNCGSSRVVMRLKKSGNTNSQRVKNPRRVELGRRFQLYQWAIGARPRPRRRARVSIRGIQAVRPVDDEKGSTGLSLHDTSIPTRPLLTVSCSSPSLNEVVLLRILFGCPQLRLPEAIQLSCYVTSTT